VFFIFNMWGIAYVAGIVSTRNRLRGHRPRFSFSGTLIFCMRQIRLKIADATILNAIASVR
jgi:hypothetical protein